MARLDVYAMPGRDRRGYVLDVQADLLSHLNTRTVVPLLPQDGALPPIKELNPVFAIEGEPYVMVMQAIASIPAKELRRSVASLDEHYGDVTRALDILLIVF